MAFLAFPPPQGTNVMDPRTLGQRVTAGRSRSGPQRGEAALRLYGHLLESLPEETENS